MVSLDHVAMNSAATEEGLRSKFEELLKLCDQKQIEGMRRVGEFALSEAGVGGLLAFVFEPLEERVGGPPKSDVRARAVFVVARVGLQGTSLPKICRVVGVKPVRDPFLPEERRCAEALVNHFLQGGR